MSIESAIEQKIKEAMGRGEFDNLSGKGKPLNLDAYFNTPEDLRMAFSILKSNDFVPEEVRTSVEEEIARFKSGEETIYTIFTGPIADQSGEIRVPEGQSMTDEELLSMNWFVEGVQGDIPS